MSALRFEVHVDKENVTPGFSLKNSLTPGLSLKNNATPGLGLKSRTLNQSEGLKDVQPRPPRKALCNVINEQVSVTSSRGLGVKNTNSIKTDTFSNSKIPSKKSTVTDKRPAGKESRKLGETPEPVLQENVKTDVSTCQPAVTHKKQKLSHKTEPEIVITEEDYAIFPKSERLSTYVNKLLTWRPPCLFGALPESSESDSSDVEDLPLSDFVVNLPLPLPTVPEIVDSDLTGLMDDLPPPVPDFLDEDSVAAAPADVSTDVELSLDQTADTSYTFGSFQVVHGSLDTSGNKSSCTDVAASHQ